MLVDDLGCDEARISESTVILEDLDVDSLDLVEFAMSLEAEYSIDISDEDLEGFVTVGDVVKYIEARI